MTYTPYLIANMSTALNNRLQPWLSPDDAQQELFDGFVYRGTMSKRQGYKYFATGLKGGEPYRESRIVHQQSAVPMVGALDGVNRTYTLAATGPIARGSIIAASGTPVQVLNDDGLGTFTGNGVGTVNYTTGAISVTFTAAPTVTQPIVTYSFMGGTPVMMIANYITATNIKELIVCDTRYVNRYNITFNILEDISPAAAYTGTIFDFFSWLNYPDAANLPRLLFCNNKDPIQQYDGTVVTDYVFTMDGVATLTCSFMVQMKDRLILLRTTEDGQVFPQRIRISGTGANCDDFRISATGAGFIDIPDGTWIKGAAFNRDDLIIFTEGSVWSMKYTGNDTKPFVIDRIDESRGSNATFSAITYLNRTTAASPRGLIISDGYRVERQDDSIPNFSFNEIDSENFDLCFAGSVDADRDHYLIYPPAQRPKSERILTTNYDEDNYAIYRLPLSCMGTYIEAYDVTWTDLLAYNNWDEFAAAYGDWNHFAYSKGNPISLGGGHHGEIWQLNLTEEEDNQVRVRAITVTGPQQITVTTDFNNFSLNDFDMQKGADVIFLTGIGGMVQVNNQQFAITEIVDDYTFRLDVPSTTGFSAYTTGGTATRVIPFDALMKKFNPYVDSDKKVRCGWLYMYVDSSKTALERQVVINASLQTNPCVILTDIAHNFKTGDSISIFGVVGMTEINNLQFFITVLSPTTFSLNGIDATGFTAYVSGGYAAVSLPTKLTIEIIVNDNEEPTQLMSANQNPYQGNCTNLTFEQGAKKWYKVFINQTGRFIQFRFKSQQAGATINIQAVMPGFQPVGRLL